MAEKGIGHENARDHRQNQAGGFVTGDDAQRDENDGDSQVEGGVIRNTVGQIGVKDLHITDTHQGQPRQQEFQGPMALVFTDHEQKREHQGETEMGVVVPAGGLDQNPDIDEMVDHHDEGNGRDDAVEDLQPGQRLSGGGALGRGGGRRHAFRSFSGCGTSRSGSSSR